ncbi:MAG: DUF4437 domain-containing protein [Verrucomicrobiota bacterium]
MKNNIVFAATLLSVSIGLIAMSEAAAEPAAAPATDIVLRSDVEWEQLNPARGDKSPKAGTLWGDRKGTVATGFLVEFVDGFSSPPHIHNVTYRGVVISGLIHNDDPDAKPTWMPPGSFWTQPKGEEHITAAKGSTNVAFIEIDHGPYLVMPPTDAFDDGERSINVDPSNMVWLDSSELKWIDQSAASGTEIAFLWGATDAGQMGGSFVKLPAGFQGDIIASGSLFQAVVIEGTPSYHLSAHDAKAMEPGSYFGSKQPGSHPLSSAPDTDSLVYVRTNGAYKVVSN